MILGQKIRAEGGKIIPLLLPHDKLKGPVLTNASCYNYKGTLLVNLRCLNYVLYHSETCRNSHVWGPLVYLHPENDITLTTYNYVLQLDSDYNTQHFCSVDTSKFDVPPKWEFVGLEDCRIFDWENKLFLCGVRRDTTTNGQGRMELSEIAAEGPIMKEISRQRIPAPPPDTEYCNKNWMPILDIPYHFIKWTNPTDIVEYDPKTKETKSVFQGAFHNLGTIDLRGGSQVLRYKDHFIAFCHESHLYQSQCGRKDATYRHRAVVWDENFRLVRVSPEFSFLNAKIEFCVGLADYNGKFVATFGYQDNAAFLCEISYKLMDELTGL